MLEVLFFFIFNGGSKHNSFSFTQTLTKKKKQRNRNREVETKNKRKKSENKFNKESHSEQSMKEYLFNRCSFFFLNIVLQL